jgi:hypothetical protein
MIKAQGALINVNCVIGIADPSVSISAVSLPTAWRARAHALARASIVLTLSLAYFSYVFRIWEGTFLTRGIGDWQDPYFINYLLEHWQRSLVHFSDPTSPPMYFPAEGTLGYSHALLLYVPFYAAAKAFVSHPFAAYNLALFLVLEIGTLSLYGLFRRFGGLSVLESLLLTAFFATCPNVIEGGTGIWSQRASVFLIPPILWIGFASGRMPEGWTRMALAGLAGLLATLLFSHDFYTGQLALFVVLLLVPGLYWSRQDRFAPLLSSIGRRVATHRRFLLGLAGGAAVGAVVLLWIYLGAFLEHSTFPEDQLDGALKRVDASQWHSVGEAVSGLVVYPSRRSFILVFVATIAISLPWFRASRSARRASLWFLFVSLVVLVIPLRWDGFSFWKAVFAPLPGFSVIRDPKRVIFLYELAVALLAAVLLARLPKRSAARVALTILMFVLIVAGWNRRQFSFDRPVAEFDRWVAAPVSAYASCASFFIKGASDTYMARSPHRWTLYGIDAMFIALGRSVPTLNGYSAWAPDGWSLANPQEPDYMEHVDRWIDAKKLQNVCALDIEERTLRLHRQ